MSDVDDFLADILPRLREAEIALHNGDAGPRSALWSHDDPVTPDPPCTARSPALSRSRRVRQ